MHVLFIFIIMDNKITHHNLLKGYSMLLYFSGSMIMHEPSEECVVDFWKNGIINRLPVRSSNPNFVLASAQLRESCEDKKTCGRKLREDFIRLFGRKEMPLAPPYGSLYDDPGDSASDKNSTNVSEFYSAYGWESKFKDKIKDDHLGIELLFLTLLVEKYLVLDDSACQSEMRKEIRRFIYNHILSWINEWNNMVQRNAATLCFKGIGTLILACVEDIYSILGQFTAASLQYGDLKN